MDVEELYDEYVSKVYKFFYVQSLNKHIAQDLTSQTFLSLVERAEKTSVQNGKTYLYGIMRNVWSSYLREKYQRQESYLETTASFEAYAEESVEAYEGQSYIDRAESYILRLPEKQQQIARMRFLDGMRVRDIAKKLQKSSSYVKTTQGRALTSLKKMLESPEGATE